MRLYVEMFSPMKCVPDPETQVALQAGHRKIFDDTLAKYDSRKFVAFFLSSMTSISKQL